MALDRERSGSSSKPFGRTCSDQGVEPRPSPRVFDNRDLPHRITTWARNPSRICLSPVANSLFRAGLEPALSDHVQITVSETVRRPASRRLLLHGRRRCGTGAEPHLCVVCLTAMEPLFVVQAGRGAEQDGRRFGGRPPRKSRRTHVDGISRSAGNNTPARLDARLTRVPALPAEPLSSARLDAETFAGGLKFFVDNWRCRTCRFIRPHRQASTGGWRSEVFIQFRPVPTRSFPPNVMSGTSA